MPYINSWCLVRDRQITANGQPVAVETGADLSAFLINAYRQLDLGYPKFYKMDRLSQLGFLAAELALQGRFDREAYVPDEVGVVLANAHSSLDTDLRYHETAATIPSPAVFVYTLPNIVIGEICIRHGLKGENTFFIFEKYDIDFLNKYIDNLLEEGAARAVIGGWVDVMHERGEAFLYLVEKDRKYDSVIHNYQNISTLYGSVDAGA